MENNMNIHLAIPSVPVQQWGQLYNLAQALQEGTIFQDLNKPFFMGGIEYGK